MLNYASLRLAVILSFLPLEFAGLAQGAKPKPLQLKLSPLEAMYVVGHPMRIKAELINPNPTKLWFHHQFSPFNWELIVRGPKDKSPLRLGPWAQTYVGLEPVGPNQTLTLIEDYDLSFYYLIDQPGTYTLSVPGRAGFEYRSETPLFADFNSPEEIKSLAGITDSNRLTIEVRPGALRTEEVLLKKLCASFPDMVCRAGESASGGVKPAGREKGRGFAYLLRTGFGSHILLVVSEGKLSEESSPKGTSSQTMSEYLGQSSSGHIYAEMLAPMGEWGTTPEARARKEGAERRWPEMRFKIKGIPELSEGKNSDLD